MIERLRAGCRRTAPSRALSSLTLIATMLLLTALACGGQGNSSLEPDRDQERASGQARTPASAGMTTPTTQERGDQPATVPSPDIQPTAATSRAYSQGSATRVPTSQDTGATPNPTAETESTTPVQSAGLYHLSQAARVANFGKRNKAVIYHATNAIAANPGLTDAYLLRAYSYNLLRQFDLALQDLDRAIELGPIEYSEEPPYVSDAVRRLESRFGNADGMGHAQSLRGYALTRLGRHDEALEALEALKALDPTNRTNGALLTLVHYNMGNYEKANEQEACCFELFDIQTTTEVLETLKGLDLDIKLSPANGRFLMERALAHYTMGEYQKFLDDHDRAVSFGETPLILEPRRAFYRLGKYELIHQLADERVKIYEQQRKDSTSWLQLRARGNLGLGRLEAAEQDLQQAVDQLRANKEQVDSFDSNIVRTTLSLSLVRVAQGKQPQTLDELDAFCGGRLLMCRTPIFQIMVHAEELLDFESAQNPHLHLYRAGMLCRDTQFFRSYGKGYQTASRSFTCEYPDYALYDFEQVIALDPSVKEAYAGRAVAYANIHGLDDPKTEEFYQQALDIDPNNIPLYNHRSVVRASAQQYQGAIEDVSTLIDIDKEWAVNHYFRRAGYHQKAGDKALAEADYLMALELGYDRSAVREALLHL